MAYFWYSLKLAQRAAKATSKIKYQDKIKLDFVNKYAK